MRVQLAALVAASIGVATPAAAASIWLKCDGLPGQGAEMAKQVAKILVPFGAAGMPEVGKDRPQAEPADGVAACTSALDNPSIKESWRRRANVLRARALHNLLLQKPDAALADIASARSEAGAHLQDPNVQRTLGVSLLLEEATALAVLERKQEAIAAAIAAADGRPWSPGVQRAAGGLLHHLGAAGPDLDRILARLDALSPGGADLVRKTAAAEPATQKVLNQVNLKMPFGFLDASLPLGYLTQDVTQIEEHAEFDTLQPQGVLREAGYKERRLAPGAMHVEFADPGPVGQGKAVEELVLLRAAQLAKANGAKGFVISKRQDNRMWMGRGGFPEFIHGFKSEMDIAFVPAPEATPEHMVDADQVLAALLPAFS